MGRLIDATTFADLEARRFTLRVSATRRDTKASRKDTKMQQGSELPGLGQGASSVKSERESLDGHARIRAGIDQQPKLALRHSQIVDNLPMVFVGQSAHRLELQCVVCVLASEARVKNRLKIAKNRFPTAAAFYAIMLLTSSERKGSP